MASKKTLEAILVSILVLALAEFDSLELLALLVEMAPGHRRVVRCPAFFFHPNKHFYSETGGPE